MVVSCSFHRLKVSPSKEAHPTWLVLATSGSERPHVFLTSQRHNSLNSWSKAAVVCCGKIRKDWLCETYYSISHDLRKTWSRVPSKTNNQSGHAIARGAHMHIYPEWLRCTYPEWLSPIYILYIIILYIYILILYIWTNPCSKIPCVFSKHAHLCWSKPIEEYCSHCFPTWSFLDSNDFKSKNRRTTWSHMCYFFSWIHGNQWVGDFFSFAAIFFAMRKISCGSRFKRRRRRRWCELPTSGGTLIMGSPGIVGQLNIPEKWFNGAFHRKIKGKSKGKS